MLGDLILGDIDLNQLDIQLGESTIHLSDLALNVDFLNQKTTTRLNTEFSGFLLYKELGRRLKGPLAFYKGFVPNFGWLGRIMECDHVLNFGTGEKTFCKGGAKSTYPPEKQHKGAGAREGRNLIRW
ncbi:hypothetical protein J5N97_001539 [Dioscorea zingiberensis]|uniref:Uncharacterized protein n=1 Tax=Dioscorea zingiberensis TaxID=325984 RepID=A0A9D5BVD6_9LILI|nr:hypothetical protein J5N97_001539 [Dioscorea zingiberensis]